MAESSPPAVPTPRAARRKIPKPVVRLARLVVIAVVAWLLLRLLRGVDWGEVGHALTHLSAWQIAVLLVATARVRMCARSDSSRSSRTARGGCISAGGSRWRVAVQFLPVVVGLLTIVVWRRFTWNG